jgi:PAS domain S-box-containing protein
VNERVLVVEDNQALAENVAEMLSDEGIQVFLAADTDSADKIAARAGFDLAIVDISLAGNESGLDLLPLLRRHSVDGEIVLMTGNATLHSAIEAIRRGVYAYIPKPFEPEHLVTLVKRALAQVALKREKQALSHRLSASEALYRSMVETVEACILGLSREGTIHFANRFAAERLGVSQASLVGRDFTSLARPDSAQKLALALAQAISGEPVRDHEGHHDAGQQRPRVIRWTLTPLQARSATSSSPDTLTNAAAEEMLRELEGGAGTQSLVLAVGIDITARLELERKAAETEAMAVMGTLTTSLAHEIRNPLNAAKLQLELLIRRAKRAVDTPAVLQVVEPAELVRSELDRLSSLLDDFLNLARPRQIDRRPCSVLELLQSVVTLKQPLSQSLGVSLSIQVSDPLLSMRADSSRLKQVLLNLLGNAIEALSDRGHGCIEVQAEAVAQGGVAIAVCDDGPGVSASVLDAAFQPFVTSKQGGTGLGLAIVRKIVAQHGGEIELLPRAGGGTIARFTISP